MTELTESTSTAIAPTAEGKVPVQMGIAPKGLEEAWRLACHVANSTIVPKDFQGKPANVLIAIEAGLKVGIPWLQAVQGSAIINGRHGFYGDLFLAIILTSFWYDKHEEYYEVMIGGTVARRDGITVEDMKRDDTTAVCTFWRKGKDTPTTRRFTVGQAKKAGLWTKEGPWQTYPDRMLAMRAREFAARDTFPDALKGMRSVEELRDLPAITADTIESEPLQPRRASEARDTPASVPDPLPPSGGTPSEAVAPSVPNEGVLGTVTPAVPSSPAVPPRETRGLLISHTAFVRPKAGEPYYEVEAMLNNGGRVTFVTREEQIYKEAASFEGTDHCVAITWRQAKTRECDIVSVIQAIAIDETTPVSTRPDTPNSDLFT